MINDIQKKLLEITSDIQFDEPMAKHTSFRIGGKADYFWDVSDIETLQKLLDFVKQHQIPYFVMGNGTNLLVSDEGYRGMIFCFSSKFNQLKQEGNTLIVQSGATVKETVYYACNAGLTKMEGLEGIPGTIGGAVFMNAGAYGYEFSQIIVEVKVFSYEKGIYTLPASALQFGYRHSIFRENSDIILETKLKLEYGQKDEILARAKDYHERRCASQPLEYPSAGSTFKRPQGFYTGKLIQEAGLKGYQIGQAMVSNKHSGFVINVGDATANEVYHLISSIQGKIKEQYGVTLEPEVILLGEFKM